MGQGQDISINVAIVGCGYWGKNYVRIVHTLKNACCKYVCDQNVELLSGISDIYPNTNCTDRLDDILEDASVTAVIVVVPAKLHFDIVRKSLLAGKHVLVEKPLTLTSLEGKEIVDLAEKMNRVLLVGHTFAYNAALRLAKDYASKENFGKIHTMVAKRTNLGPIRDDVSALWDLAPHDISIFHLLNDGISPIWVSATGLQVLSDANLEDVSFITLRYPNGVIGHIHVSWLDPNKERTVTIVGTHQRIAFDDMNSAEPVRIYEKGIMHADAQKTNLEGRPIQFRNGQIISPVIPACEPLSAQVKDFLDCINMMKTPVADGNLGVAVIKILECCEKSIQMNGAPVSLDTN